MSLDNILPSVGDRVSASEIRARWAYSEMRSSRFRARFAPVYADLVVKANSRVAFSELRQADRDRLLLALNAARNPEFVGYVDATAATYECRSWTENELFNAWALPEFNPTNRDYCISFRAFLSAAEPPVLATLDDSDPRVEWQKQRSLCDTGEYRQDEPIIIIGKPGTQIILDGYFRTLTFVNSRKRCKRLLVWIPLVGCGCARAERLRSAENWRSFVPAKFGPDVAKIGKE
jgi:hypothetical protein